MLASVAQAATVVTRAIKINDEAITPASDIESHPGDRIEAEIYLSGWNADAPGSTVRSYQVAFDALSLFQGDGSGALLPLGWDALSLKHCGADQTCLGETQICSIYRSCQCTVDDSCPDEYPICTGVCAGPAHNPESAFTVDETRADFVHFGFVPIAAARSVTHGDDPAIGSTVLLDFGPSDTGQTAYIGTILLQVSDDACGEFTVAYSTRFDENFLILNPSPGKELVVPTLVPLTVNVPTDAVCIVPPAAPIASKPSVNTRLSRTRRNTIILTFDRDVTLPAPGALTIHELTDTTCAGPGPGGDLSGFFQIAVGLDEMGRPRVLRLRDNSTIGVLEHGSWYRVTNNGAWPGTAPFELDYQVAMGDANNNGFVSFADLSIINLMIPMFHVPETDRLDINADGRINFADLSAANVFNPSSPSPRPCQE